MKREVKPVFDSTGKLIKLHDVLRDDRTGEMGIVNYGENKTGVYGLGVSNDIIGSNDWLDVYPNGVWTIVGNMSIYEK